MLVFSPHPDDDVISMGGILHKLAQNGNGITVAYMTSGNIAVFDHDVRRYVDFLERLARDRGIGQADVPGFTAQVREFLRTKQPGAVDSDAIQDVKRIIREGEAVSALETIGLGRDHARFLNLPFYQTGKVRKDPIGPADVAIVRALLEAVRPQLIFVAGDLSDPHGTHRMCKEAIDRALAAMSGTHAGGVALSRRLAGMAGDRGDLAGADEPGGTEAQDPGDLQAPEPEGLGAVSRARTTSASSGSGWRRGTRRRQRCSIDSASPSTSPWRRTSSREAEARRGSGAAGQRGSGAAGQRGSAKN